MGAKNSKGFNIAAMLMNGATSLFASWRRFQDAGICFCVMKAVWSDQDQIYELFA